MPPCEPRFGRALQPDGSVDVIRIVRALGAERGRWLRESADRLARFGYTPDVRGV